MEYWKSLKPQDREKSLTTLRGPRELNDRIIDAYFSLLVQRSQDNPGLPKVFAMNCFFWPILSQNGISAVKKWKRTTNFDDYDKIFGMCFKNIIILK